MHCAPDAVSAVLSYNTQVFSLCNIFNRTTNHIKRVSVKHLRNPAKSASSVALVIFFYPQKFHPPHKSMRCPDKPAVSRSDINADNITFF